MHKCLPRDATHSAVFAVVRCPSVCHVDVSKRPNLLSNFFIAWWPHHSSFPTVKFRRGHHQQGRQIEVGYQKFAIFNQYFRNTDTEYRGISRYRIPNRHEKIPTKILNTDTDSKYRYRPSSSLYRLYSRALSWDTFVFSIVVSCAALCGLWELWFFVRIGQIRFLSGCRKRWLNQG